MPKVEIELTAELIEAIDANRGSQTRDAFIEAGMKWATKPKETLNKAYFRKRWVF